MKSELDDHDWDTLLGRIGEGKCTPFLGAGASAHVLPTGEDLADRWSAAYDYPVALPGRRDLARVAQYLAITRDYLRPRELVARLCKEIDPVSALRAGDSYDILASLDLPLFMTTNYDDLLVHALRNKRKEPKIMLCPWHMSIYEAAGKTHMFEPDSQHPAVYYLHGNAASPGSIVVTEADYLDFIVWVTANWKQQASKSHIAPIVKRALAETSLVFIGYSLNDWSFRVLMRCIKQTGASLGALNVAVQLNPVDENSSEVDQDDVSHYLSMYLGGFQSGSPIRLYWGTADEFLQELQSRMSTIASR